MLFESTYSPKNSPHQLFEQKVAEFPDHTAIVFGQKSLTYIQVNQKANQLAQYLRSCGVSAESLVGICMERCPEFIISILAVWKAGGAYIPIDPSYPLDRIKFMIEDSAIGMIITHLEVYEHGNSPFENFSGKTLIWEEVIGTISTFSSDNLDLSVSLSDLAYVIYTSGSTGKPKGVLLEHRGLANLIPTQIQRFEVTHSSRVLQFASISFDTSIWEILLPLASGATLVLARPQNLVLDQPLSQTLKGFGITHFTAPPSVLALLDPTGFPDLQVVVSGGEALRKEIALRWASHKKLFNAYGPTEATIEVSTARIYSYTNQIYLGEPLPYTQFYILDQEGKELPAGTLGELHIGGAGVARGYLNRPELTAEKFVADPFNPGGKMYRSGDLVCRTPDGEIEYLGRIDEQVKIRGFRIELGEIESALLCFPDLNDVIVTIRKGADESDFLCAYYVAREEKSITDLRNFLSKSLPGYMLPSRFVYLKEFPLTPNGKIDRKALPDPGDSVSTGADFVAPISATEKILVNLWAKLLGLNPDSIGTRDNFFALGGDSLRAAQLSGRISQETHTAVSVKDIFSNPTIAGLSELIAKRERTALSVIAKAPVQESYPLASAQKRVYLHSLQQGDGSVLYNMPAVYQVDGKIDHTLLTAAFQLVVDRFDAFRTSFALAGGELRQQVASAVTVDVPFLQSSESTLEKKLQDWGQQPFDLQKAPLIRMELWQTESRQLILIDIHHIIMDGMSYGPFFEALSKAYAGEDLTAPSLSYIDYVCWQQSEAQQLLRSKQAAYWNSMFADGIPALELPTDFGETAERTYLGGTQSFLLEGPLFEQVKQFCKQTGTTPFMLLYSAFTLLISKFSQKEDLVIATTSSGRNLPETEDMVGMFVNTLAIRNTVDSSLPFTGFLERTKQLLLESFENEAYPYDELIAGLRARQLGDKGINVMFTLLKEDYEHQTIKGAALHLIKSEKETPAMFDLTFSGFEAKDNVAFEIEYAMDLFNGETIGMLAERFVNLLRHALSAPEKAVAKLPILLVQEAEQIRSWNDTKMEAPQSALVHQLFEQKAAEFPDHTALVFEKEELTYAELNKKANQLAHFLRSCGIGAESKVGLCMNRSSELIISILAVWKSGGAYVPLDPDYPQERLQFMVEDSSISHLLAHHESEKSIEAAIQNFMGGVLIWEELPEEIHTFSSENLNLPLKDTDLSYVIYTSGSTGKPKGVLLEHKGLNNLIPAQLDRFEITSASRFLQFASISFDTSLWEIILSLSSGASLVLVKPENLLLDQSLSETLRKFEITHFTAPPSVLAILNPSDFPALEVVVSGGEALRKEIAQRWAKQKKLFNAYGPTEATIEVSASEIKSDTTAVAIGKPLPNTSFYVLDKEGNQLPIGIPGELHIGGVGVARGYLNRPELTAEKFIPDPFGPGQRMYRTGDLARWLNNGEVEYLGRIDEQVKIRGFRIELGEIESALLCFPDLNDVIVTIRKGADESDFLCAYYVALEEKSITDLRNFLSKSLPGYMLPSRFVYLKEFPLTPNGKIDRKALPDPGDSVSTGSEFVAPATEPEKSIARLWAQLLGLNPDSIGTRDNFFALGGDSLRAAQLSGRISQETETAVSAKDIFSNPTIAGLSELIAKRERTALSVIAKAPVQESYPLASAQKRVYLHSLQQGEGSVLYNMPAVYEVGGRLDLVRLNKAFQQVVDHFAAFRTSFLMEDGDLRQRVESEIKVTVPVRELKESALQEKLGDWGKVPFDLGEAPLIRMELWQTESRQILAIDTHHVIMDGMSLWPFSQALSQAYQGVGPNISSDKNALSYIDYVCWQQSEAQQVLRAKQAAFWNSMFADGIPALELPTDFREPAERSFQGGTHSFFLDGPLFEQVQQFCKQTGITPFMLLYSAFTLLISKFSQKEDLVIATTSSGRNLPETEDMVGMFVNTLAIRNTVDSGLPFIRFLERTKQMLLESFENDAFPYDELISGLRARQFGDNAAQVMFTMLKEGEELLAFGQNKLEILRFSEETPAKFDLTFSGSENSTSIGFDIVYSAELFSRESISMLAERFVNLLRHALSAPEKAVSKLPILLDQEAEKIQSWNSNTVDVPKSALVHQLFEQKAIEFPGHTALIFEEEELTYEELNKKANRLAHCLRERGVRAESKVGICLERSSELIISILAVWKSGGAYVPLDPSYPTDRLAFMIGDSGMELILTQESLLPLMEKVCLNTAVVPVAKEELEQVLAGYEDSNPLLESQADNLAYIIYTSGTTGRPKGAMIEHRNAVNLAYAQHQTLTVKPTDRILQFASISFDASAFEILLALTAGAALVMASKENLMPGTPLKDVLNQNRVTVAVLTPVALYHLDTDHIPSLRKVLSAGEVLPLTTARKWSQTKILFNAYGPTEITVCATMKPINKEDKQITIGKPIPNYKTYILDSHGNQLPVGIPGELCIGGAGVGRGYLNRPELTAEKFVVDPFNPGGKMYRSGDLVRWLSNGEIEYLGRIDQQVKIRGFRIELGEIESALLSASDIREAAVTVRQDHLGEKYLCGYYAADGEKTVEELRGFLGQTLPEFMIPARFVALERLPIGPTGKIDRKALPDPGDSVSTGSEFVAPATEPEKSIARLWAQLLGLNPDSIGTRDNFFALGGDSLRAAQLSGRISQETETAVSVKDIFSNPTIAGLSELIAKRERTALSVIAKAPVQESYPLASAQKRVYLHSLQQGEGSVLYNMPAVYEVGGRLDLVRLNKAFQQVVDHFAAFRTSFLMEDGDLRQRVESEIKVTVPVRELKESALQEKLGDWGKEPFNLNKAPLIRLELWQTESRQFLAINTHHIIMDGMSYGPFFDALSKAYAGEVLTAKSVQYIDYAVWQTSAEQQAIIAQQGTYWQRIYAQDVPVLELPYDFPMPANRTYAGGMFLFELEPKTVEGIKYLAAQTGTTPFMVLYSVFALLVGKYAGQTAVVVGTTSSGRNIPQLEDMLGMLVNTLAIRTELQGNLTFNAYLEANKKVLLESFENDSYPYEDLVTDLRQNGNSKIPVRTMFTMMPKGAEEISVDSNVLSAVDVDGVALSKFDLTFNGVEGAESIDFLITYPSELFHSDTISLMAARFEQLLQQAVQKPDSLLQELSIRVEKEKELVSGWNDTYRDFPTSQTLSELFESTVRLYPENTALVYKDLEINYEELERKANQLACVLIDQGIKTGDLVGLLLTKSPDLVVSILAIWKAGGAYVPLDPSYPTDRLHYMLEDAGVSLLLTHEVAQTAAIKASEGLPILMFVYEDLESDLYKPSTDKLPCAASPIDLAYVIYTSGSTGKPKGVMIEHRTAVNLAFAFKESMGTIAEPRILQFASISFDASVTDLLMAFANGGTLVIADRENLMPGPALTETLNRYQISHIKLTPTALGYLSPDDLPYLYTVYAGGEALTLELARRWASKKRLINAYGPTEATVNTTLRHIEGDEKRVTLGRPLANYQIQILDQSGNVLPVGMPGELCIGGDGLARGYLNRPELTAEKFISDPIRTGGRLYRSGDLARWLSNGEIEFLGRIDHQVKIRGFRIECGEIESALLGINGVSAAAVVARTDAKDEKYLCAYFVANEEKTINELRGLLSRTLPEFMVPARFVQLDKLPLTGSGKTDRKALPAPGEDFKTGKVFIAPNTQQEKIMIEVWAATLGIRPDVISMEDDFFALGGNSLKAVVLIAKIHQRLEVQIPVQMIFQNSTPKSLIDHFEKVESNDDQFDAHLIPLQPTGSKTPLFIVPGIEGKCYYLIELAKSLGEDQPVYGFQSVGLLPGEQPFETVEEIAAYNIGLMKKVQTQGPYLLAGHSMGGWMAMEMANQLLRQGEKVAFLGLLDSYSPKVLADLGGFQIHSKERDINDLLMLVERLAEFFATNLDYHELKEKLDQLDHQGRLSLVLQWTVSNGLVPNAFSQEELWQWARLIGTNSRISFKPTKTGQITHLFKAEINGRENLNIADCLGWSATLPNLKIQETPGNHISMLHHPHLNSLANAIKECIQKAEVKHEQIIKKDSMDEQKRVLEIQNSKF